MRWRVKLRRSVKKFFGRFSPAALAQRARVVRIRLVRHATLVFAIAFAFTSVVTVAWVRNWFYIRDAELAAYDKALKLMTREAAHSDRVVVVAVDDYSLQAIQNDQHLSAEFGTWPFPRSFWVPIIEYLAKDGARALVFDLVMDERGPPQYNEAMAAAIARTGLPVYLGMAVLPAEHETMKFPPVAAKNRLPGDPVPSLRPHLFDEEPPQAAEGANADEGQVDPAAFTFGEGGAEFRYPTPELWAERRRWEAELLAFPVRSELTQVIQRVTSHAPGARDDLVNVPLAPAGRLLEELAGVGLVDPEEDREDGVIRRTRFAYKDGRNTYVTLPVAAAADLLGAREVSIDPGVLRIGDKTWRINTDGSAKIDYRGSLSERFGLVKLVALMQHKADGRVLPEGHFKDKVVIVGGLAVATHDTHPTPFVSISPGVVKQAAILDTLLGRGAFIVDVPLWIAILAAFIVALLSAALVTSVHSSFLDIAWPILLYTGLFVVTGVTLKLWNLHLPSTPAVWAGIGASITATAFTRLFADRNRDRLKESFVRYLDRTLVEQMAEANELPKLEGENREITAFFSDIRGFSTFSEGMKGDPQKLVRILNTYLTRVSSALMNQGGCIDKYIGDAVVCLFGAPLRQEDHAVRACRGALAVQAEVEKLREEFRAQGLPDVYTRIGLNSGVMFVGNFGSEQLFDYTAMGDDMNLAARLEGANKAYDTGIMLGEKTYALAKDHIEVRELDRVRVAGKKNAVVVYELLALKGQLSSEKQALVKLYEDALRLYREARFEDALSVLDQVDARFPNDGPSQTLRARCEKYRAGAPEGFDGVANLEK